MAESDINVLIIGSGGREHALYLALKKSPRAARIIVTPGNGGIPDEDRWSCKETEHDQLLRFAEAKKIHLVVIGPEAPIADGLTDKFRTAGIRVFAPSQAAAWLESSKAKTHQMCVEVGIPAPKGGVATSMAQALPLIRSGFRVVKASGLCAGKGVVVADSEDEAIEAARAMLEDGIHGDAGKCIVIQHRLTGREASFMYFCDGINAVPLPPARDYKRLEEGDRGPNTGGMGSYSPLSDVTASVEKEVLERIVKPTLAYMHAQGTPFHGLLFAGVMLTIEGPTLIEFNVRFGDPETQVVLPRIMSDLITHMLACTVEGGLSILPPLEISETAFVCTVLASEGYPGAYETGKLILFEGKAYRIGSYFIHAGTHRDGDNLFTSGGRVMGAIGYGASAQEARELSLSAAERVAFDNAAPVFRRDISKN